MQIITILLSALFAVTAFAQWGPPGPPFHRSEKPHSYTMSFPHSIPHYSWKREVEHTKTKEKHTHSVTKTKHHHTPTPPSYPPPYPTYGAKQLRDEDILERARPIPKVLMA